MRVSLTKEDGSRGVVDAFKRLSDWPDALALFPTRLPARSRLVRVFCLKFALAEANVRDSQ